MSLRDFSNKKNVCQWPNYVSHPLPHSSIRRVYRRAYKCNSSSAKSSGQDGLQTALGNKYGDFAEADRLDDRAADGSLLHCQEHF